MGRKGYLAVFESSNISETGEVMATKTGVHAFDINPTCMNFLSHFRSIKFSDEQYLRNQRGHGHQNWCACT